MKPIIKNNLYSLLIIALSLMFGIYLSPQLPNEIPIHWDINGHANQFIAKTIGLYLLPLLALLSILFIHIVILVSPKDYNMVNSRKSIGKINLAITLLLTAIYIGSLLSVLNTEKYNFLYFLCFGFSIFLITAGNFMSKVEQNFFIGIRVPWTLASEKNWNATHRFAAKSMFTAGILILIIIPIIPSVSLTVSLMLLSTAALPIAYSYWYFRKKEAS